MDRLVCGNSNMHNLDRYFEDSGRCTEINPCHVCLIRLGKERLAELIKERDALVGEGVA